MNKPYVYGTPDYLIELKSDKGNLDKIVINSHVYKNANQAYQELEKINILARKKIKNIHLPLHFRERPRQKPDVVIIMDSSLQYRHLWNTISYLTKFVYDDHVITVDSSKTKYIIYDNKEVSAYHLFRNNEEYNPLIIGLCIKLSDNNLVNKMVKLPIAIRPEFVNENGLPAVPDPNTYDQFTPSEFSAEIIAGKKGIADTIITGGEIFQGVDCSEKYWNRFGKYIPYPILGSNLHNNILLRCSENLQCQSFFNFFLPCEKLEIGGVENINALFLALPTE